MEENTENSEPDPYKSHQSRLYRRNEYAHNGLIGRYYQISTKQKGDGNK